VREAMTDGIFMAEFVPPLDGGMEVNYEAY
jgi:hypothetical protein